MKKLFSSIALLLLVSTIGFAEEVEPITGLFFNTVSSGARLIITTRVPNHPKIYPQAGIQILTPGFALSDPANECSSYNSRTGMCIFPVGNTVPKVISITTTATGVVLNEIVNVKLCLDGVGQLTCQHYTHRGNQFLTTQRAYVVTSSQNAADQGYVSVCDLLNAGADFGTCVESASPVLKSPQAITFNAQGNMAYLTNFGDGSVANCSLDPATGLFASCHSNPTGIPTPSSNPSGRSILGSVAVGPNYVYVPYFENNSLQIWSLNLDGSFKVKTPFSDVSFSGPNSATLSPNLKWVYVANSGTYNSGTQQYTGNTISFCEVNGSSLNTCNFYMDLIHFKGPLSVSFNALGSHIYVANANDSTVTVCDVDQFFGVISNCADSTGSFLFGTVTEGPVSNMFMQSGLDYGYVPNADTNPGAVSICRFNGGTGAFTSCTTMTSTNPQFITPTGVAINPIGGV